MYVATRLNHGKSGEQRRRPAGGLQLGSAQVQLPPRQRLHRVVVGADQLQVAAPHPVPVVHASSVGCSLRDPGGRRADRHIQLAAHGCWRGEDRHSVEKTSSNAAVVVAVGENGFFFLLLLLWTLKPSRTCQPRSASLSRFTTSGKVELQIKQP